MALAVSAALVMTANPLKLNPLVRQLDFAGLNTPLSRGPMTHGYMAHPRELSESLSLAMNSPLTDHLLEINRQLTDNDAADWLHYTGTSK